MTEFTYILELKTLLLIQVHFEVYFKVFYTLFVGVVKALERFYSHFVNPTNIYSVYSIESQNSMVG